MRRSARSPHPVSLILMTELILISIVPATLNWVSASKSDAQLATTNISARPVPMRASSSGCAGVSFTQAAGSPIGLGNVDPISIATADFNLDGKPDLATANIDPGNVTILLGNGSGGFTQPTGPILFAGSSPRQLAAGDFNRDGKPDLAVVNSVSNSITILLGDGAGGFTEPTGSPIGAAADPRCIAVGDFNLDGKPDLAVGYYGAARVSMLLGDGSGRFAQYSGSSAFVPSGNVSIVVGDFNRDGKPDLATANQANDNVFILLGDGIGGFTLPAGSPIGAGTNPDSITTGDFNRDGKADLAVANRSSNNVTILVGDGSGGFNQPASSPVNVGNIPTGIAAADFNFDGKPDLAVTNGNDGNVTMLLGDGGGEFTTAAGSPVGAGAQPQSAALGDFNLDGKPDLAMPNFASQNVTIQLNTCNARPCSSASFALPAPTFSAGNNPNGVATGDFNNDGKQDFAVASQATNDVTVYLGNGAGGFTLAGSFAALGGAFSVAVGDLNKDGKQDIVVANAFAAVNKISVFLGIGDGTFAPANNISVGSAPFQAVIGDFNGDGNPDIATGNNTSANVSVLLGNGAGGFAAAVNYPVGTQPNGLATGDFNNDGKLDIVTGSGDTNNISILLGNGMGGFAPATSIDVGRHSAKFAVGDFNTDGEQDIVFSDFGQSGVKVMMGDGLGGFTSAGNFPGSLSNGVAIGDLNGDGKQDIAYANSGSANVSVLLGNGSGGFAGPFNFDVGDFATWVAIADFDGDGKLDLVSANAGTADYAAVLLNNCIPSIPPAITCPNNITQNADAGACSTMVIFTTTAIGSPTPTVTCTPASGATFLKGTTTVNCTAANGVAPNGTCSFTVTINDTQPPTITCPSPITQGTDSNACAAVVTFTPTATDNCPLGPTPIACSPASGTTFNKGVTTVTCTATDASSNTTQCSFPVTVNDTQPPAINCPAISRGTDPNACTAVVTFTPAATDNCPLGPTPVMCTPASGATFQKGVTTVSCTATDTSNNTANCSFTVTINDSQAPTITCPTPITQPAITGQCSAVVTYSNATATDNCPGVGTPLCSPASGSTFQKGLTTVTCSVKDSSNNMSICSFTVTVNDTQAPTIACPANVTHATDPNVCTAVVTYLPTASDNCPGVGAPACSPASGTVFPKGSTTVTCSVRDSSNNMSTMCSFTVTVNDTQPPVFTNGCPAGINKAAQVSCPFTSSLLVSFMTPLATDNCGTAPTVVCNPPSGSTFPVGTTVVTCMATDSSSNTATCSFPVNVYSFCLQDDTSAGNVVFVNAMTGAYLFCQNGAPLASGTGTLVAHACSFQIDHTKGDRKVHIQGDTSENEGLGAGTAYIKKLSGGFVVQITDRLLGNNSCTCAPAMPAPAPNK